MAFGRSTARQSMNDADISARINTLKNDIGSIQSNLLELLETLGREATGRVSDATEAAGDAASAATARVERWTEQGAREARTVIRDNPLMAIVLSMGAGLLLAMLMRR